MRTGALVVMLLVPLSAGFVVRNGDTSGSLSREERQEIVCVALDYIDGFFEGDAERVSRAVHPELAKRTIEVNGETQEHYLRNMTATQLVDITASGNGVRISDAYGTWSYVTILDTFEDMASVRVDVSTWVDYLHVGKINGEWKIINVLWGSRPGL